MQLNNVVLEQDQDVLTVTINRPDKLNALDRATLDELRSIWEETVAKEDVGAVIVTGAGEKAFVAGADIRQLAECDALGGQRFSRYGQEVFDLIESSRMPVIAAVNGFALGGGCELAMACHIRIASENAYFGQPEVNLGAIPGYGGTQRLARLVGWGRAAEMILTGERIDAMEGHRIGLVNRVVPKGESLKASKETARMILAKSRVAVKYSLESLRAVHQTSLADGLRIEAALFGLCCGSSDFTEGTKAFLEKRAPQFSGK